VDDDTVTVEGETIPAGRRSGGHLTALDGDLAREMQEKKTLTFRAKRVKAQDAEMVRRKTAAAEVIEAVNNAVDSELTADKTNEELADIIVQRMAKITLMGGDLFLPTSLKEVTETAQRWSAVAKQQADRRRERLPGEPEASPVEDVRAKLVGLEKKMRERARDRLLEQAKSS
jgi:NTP pyrophosphatase (non-canonical NTP hydrolase)